MANKIRQQLLLETKEKIKIQQILTRTIISIEVRVINDVINKHGVMSMMLKMKPIYHILIIK